MVPARYFDESASRCFLSEVSNLDDAAVVEHVEIPQLGVVLVYERTQAGVPELANLLLDLDRSGEYNKILADFREGVLSLVVAQDKNLLLANVFPAQSFTTAEYFIFAALKSLQLNPEVSTICFRGDLSEEDEMSLYTYFKSVERI